MANKKNDKDTEQELVPIQKPIDVQENYSPANRTDSSGDEYVPPQPELSMPTQEAPKEESEYEKLLKLYDKQKKFDAGVAAGEKGHGVVHGIADTVRAIANMYFSTKGAPSAYEGMSEKARERYAKAKAERDKHREELYNYAMNMRKIENSDNMLKWQMERAAADAAALKEHRAAQLKEQKAKERAAQEETRLKRETSYANGIVKRDTDRWKAEARNNNKPFFTNLEAELQKQLDAGEITEGQYNIITNGITAAINSIAEERSRPKRTSKKQGIDPGDPGRKYNDKNKDNSKTPSMLQ